MLYHPAPPEACDFSGSSVELAVVIFIISFILGSIINKLKK